MLNQTMPQQACTCFFRLYNVNLIPWRHNEPTRGYCVFLPLSPRRPDGLESGPRSSHHQLPPFGASPDSRRASPSPAYAVQSSLQTRTRESGSNGALCGDIGGGTKSFPPSRTTESLAAAVARRTGESPRRRHSWSSIRTRPPSPPSPVSGGAAQQWGARDRLHRGDDVPVIDSSRRVSLPCRFCRYSASVICCCCCCCCSCCCCCRSCSRCCCCCCCRPQCCFLPFFCSGRRRCGAVAGPSSAPSLRPLCLRWCSIVFLAATVEVTRGTRFASMLWRRLTSSSFT